VETFRVQKWKVSGLRSEDLDTKEEKKTFNSTYKKKKVVSA